MRMPILAAAAVALLSSAAYAQPVGDNAGATRAPAPLTRDNGRDAAPDDAVPPPGDAQADAQADARDQRARDLFCRRDAARRTGYVSPDRAADDAQARGSIGGTLGGAVVGALIGGAAGNAGAGAAIGAGAGLLAGSAVGADNARHAAGDVQAAYADAYYGCMDEADNGPPPDYANAPPPPDGRYAYDYPPPPPYYYGYGDPYYGYGGYPYYYGPGVSFGFGGRYGYRGGYRGGFHGGGGYHGGGGHRGGHR